MNHEVICQTESDEETLTFDVSDDAAPAAWRYWLRSFAAHLHRPGIKHRCGAFIAAGYQEAAMRLLLIIVGAFAAIVCIEKPAEAAKRWVVRRI